MPAAPPIPPNDDAERAPPPVGRPRRRWRRFALALFALALALLPLVNGPIFRRIAHSQLTKIFHDLYLEGEFEVAGTLLGGPELRDVKLEGSRKLRSLTLKQADLDYQLAPLLKGNWGEGLTRIHAREIRIEIDNGEEFPTDPEIESRKSKKKAKKAAKNKDPRLWENLDALLQQEFEVSKLDLRVHSAGEPSVSIDQLSLSLRSGSGSISAAKITFPDGQARSGLVAELLTSGEPTLEITGLDLAEQLAVERLSIYAPDSPGAPPQLDGAIRLFGSQLLATQQSPTSWRTELTGGEIDLAALCEWLGKDFGISGIIDELDATVDTSAEHLVTGGVGTRMIAYQNYRTDTARANFAYREDQLSVGSLSASFGTCSFTSSGEFFFEKKILVAEATIKVPDLAELTSAYGLSAIGGNLSAVTTIRLEDGSLTSAKADVDATDISYQGAAIAKASLRATDTSFDLKADIHGDGSNRLVSSGSFDLDTSSYKAKAELLVPKLAALQAILDAFEIELNPQGMFELAWDGSGSIGDRNHMGNANIAEFDIQLGEGDPVSGQLEFEYAPDRYHLSNLTARSADLSITVAARLAEQRLDVDALQLSNRNNPIANADISIPFDTSKLSDLDSFFDQPGPLRIKIGSEQLELADLMAIIGRPAPASATFNAKIDIGGTLEAPSGSGSLDILQIRSAGAKDLEPADAHLTFDLGSGQLSIDGTLSHPELKPITIKGHTPLRVREMAGLSGQSIDLSFHLPQTDLALAKKYIPVLSTASGVASADIKITGSVEAPQLSGDLLIESPLLKFEQQKIPTISDLNIALHLQGQQLQIESFSSYVAGGKITLDGKAEFDTLDDPVFDLSLNAEQALIFRDNNFSLRANADLKLSGPFTQAALAGRIGITQSRFYREIEIFPIGLPKGSPTPAAPKAPSFSSRREIGVTAQPFSDWAVDLRIVTDDPFLVRSNLARADITSDLRIGGTLGKPIPTGAITLEEGRATLPFSDLKSTQGSLTFSEKTGFDPQINLRAISEVQDYGISVIAYGSPSAPKTIISSDPPLAEAQIITLLATGSKPSDLSNGGVIAGDAALLLIDKLRRRYGKGTPLERKPGDLQDMLSFKAGQIDPRTGKRAASASIEVKDNVFLLGNIDVEGEYRGLVKFVFRFK